MCGRHDAARMHSGPAGRPRRPARGPPGGRPRGRLLLSDRSRRVRVADPRVLDVGPPTVRTTARRQGRDRDGAQPHFRGYTRLGGELTRGQVDWREQIDIGPERPPIGGPGRSDYLWLQGPNQWPAALPELRRIVAEWDAALSAVARILLRHWAASLGSPPDVFDAAFAEAPATLIKIIRYPAAPPARRAWARTRTPGCSPCCWPSRAAGPAGARRRDGGWIDVPRARAHSSSISASCSRSRRAGTCGPPSTGSICGERRDRFSVPYFFNPRLDAQIPVLSLPDELGARAASGDRSLGPDLRGLRPQRLEEQATGPSGCRRGARIFGRTLKRVRVAAPGRRG